MIHRLPVLIVVCITYATQLVGVEIYYVHTYNQLLLLIISHSVALDQLLCLVLLVSMYVHAASLCYTYAYTGVVCSTYGTAYLYQWYGNQ